MYSSKFKIFRKLFFPLIIFLIVLVYFSGSSIWFYFTTKGYQSVFLANGQVYFGKLSSRGSFFKLTDVYYLQATESLQQSGLLEKTNTTNTGGQSKIQLIKLGSELHGPEDTMYIEKDKVLFWENMRGESKVVQAIAQDKSK